MHNFSINNYLFKGVNKTATSHDNQGQPFNRTLFLIIIMIGMFCSNFNQTILAVAQPTLMHTFGVTAATAQWLSTGYSLIVGIMTPVTAWLADNFSSKWLFEFSMGFFLIGTTSCYLANSFNALLVGRLIQAIGGALLAGIGTTMLYSIYPAKQRGTVSALMGIVFGLAPAIGPTFSGWVLDNWDWHNIFGALIPLILLAFILGFFGLRDVVMENKSRLDWPSVILSTLGFGSLLYGFAMIGNLGWTNWQVSTGIIVGSVLVVLFIRRQLHITNPVLKLDIFKSHNYSISVSITSISQIAFAGFEFVLPLYLQTVHGFSAMESGMCLILGALVNAAMSPITGYALNHFNGKRMIRVGLVIMLLGTLPFIFVTPTTPLIEIILLYAVRSFGFSAVQMPVTTMGINGLTKDLISHGSSGNNMMRFTASAIGTAILISVQQDVANQKMLTQASKTSALLSGYHVAFAIVFILLVLGLIMGQMLKEKEVLNK